MLEKNAVCLIINLISKYYRLMRSVITTKTLSILIFAFDQTGTVSNTCHTTDTHVHGHYDLWFVLRNYSYKQVCEKIFPNYDKWFWFSLFRLTQVVSFAS